MSGDGRIIIMFCDSCPFTELNNYIKKKEEDFKNERNKN